LLEHADIRAIQPRNMLLIFAINALRPIAVVLTQRASRVRRKMAAAQRMPRPLIKGGFPPCCPARPARLHSGQAERITVRRGRLRTSKSPDEFGLLPVCSALFLLLQQPCQRQARTFKRSTLLAWPSTMTPSLSTTIGCLSPHSDRRGDCIDR